MRAVDPIFPKNLDAGINQANVFGCGDGCHGGYDGGGGDAGGGVGSGSYHTTAIYNTTPHCGSSRNNIIIVRQCVLFSLYLNSEFLFVSSRDLRS